MHNGIPTLPRFLEKFENEFNPGSFSGVGTMEDSNTKQLYDCLHRVLVHYSVLTDSIERAETSTSTLKDERILVRSCGRRVFNSIHALNHGDEERAQETLKEVKRDLEANSWSSDLREEHGTSSAFRLSLRKLTDDVIDPSDND